jgi:hypothetical protein
MELKLRGGLEDLDENRFLAQIVFNCDGVDYLADVFFNDGVFEDIMFHVISGGYDDDETELYLVSPDNEESLMKYKDELVNFGLAALQEEDRKKHLHR